jgi:hypothetical protein
LCSDESVFFLLLSHKFVQIDAVKVRGTTLLHGPAFSPSIPIERLSKMSKAELQSNLLKLSPIPRDVKVVKQMSEDEIRQLLTPPRMPRQWAVRERCVYKDPLPPMEPMECFAKTVWGKILADEPEMLFEEIEEIVREQWNALTPEQQAVRVPSSYPNIFSLRFHATNTNPNPTQEFVPAAEVDKARYLTEMEAASREEFSLPLEPESKVFLP